MLTKYLLYGFLSICLLSDSVFSCIHRHTTDSVITQKQGSLVSIHRRSPDSVFSQEQGSLVSIHRHTPDSVF